MASVGEVLVRGLKARGVEVVFGIPGAHTIELYRGLAGSGVRHVTARHEGGAAFMADGYARVSGKPGVALVISGPGLTNALTAIGQARMDSVPILVISGVNHRSSLGQGLGFLHELPDQAGMMRTVCPSFQVTAPEMLGPVMDMAFAALTGGRPGPVHVEVPLDVMPMDCPEPKGQPKPFLPRAPHPDAVAEAAALLNAARRPVILAGGGARGAASVLRALAERLDAPVVQTMNARGLMWGHALSLAASPSLEAVRGLLAASDRILAIGTEVGETEYDGYASGHMADLSGMIRVDVCPLQLARRAARLTIAADARLTAEALLPLIAGKSADGAARTSAAMAEARRELATRWPEFVQPALMLEAMRAALPGAIIVGDSTQPVYAGNLVHDHDRAGGWFNSGVGFGSLGYAPGAAVGAALAAPGVPVICLVGDGGLQFSPGELRTAVDEKLPVTFVVWNSSGYLEIEKYMVEAGTEVIGCHPSPLRMGPFAAACDLPFQSVACVPAELADALGTAAPGPRLIEVRAPV
jgi:acetolactate synthase-1/2/3 large subunit